jgi:hypothetical protein
MPPTPGPEVIAPRNCATGAQAAHRHPGEVAARRRYWTRAQSTNGLHPPVGPTHPSTQRFRAPPRITIRAPAGAATDHARRAVERAWEGRYGNPNPQTSAIPKLSPGAPALRACRLRVGILRCWRLPPGAHPHPHARGRGDGQRAAGVGTGRDQDTPGAHRAARRQDAPDQPSGGAVPGDRAPPRLRPSGSYRQAHLRYGRAGCASASR